MPLPPKDPKVRQRRNVDVTAAALIDTSPLAAGLVPELPVRYGPDGEVVPWRSESIDLWSSLWSSPMATEYTQADLHRVVLYVDLWDRYWTKPTNATAGEIRLQGVCLGVTPMDRRRLQWEIKRVQEPVKPTQQRPERLQDPRAVLKAVP